MTWPEWQDFLLEANNDFLLFTEGMGRSASLSDVPMEVYEDAAHRVRRLLEIRTWSLAGITPELRQAILHFMESLQAQVGLRASYTPMNDLTPTVAEVFALLQEKIDYDAFVAVREGNVKGNPLFYLLKRHAQINGRIFIEGEPI